MFGNYKFKFLYYKLITKIYKKKYIISIHVTMCICSKCSEEKIHSLLKNIFVLLEKHDLLTDSYILDFFVDQHWQKLPLTWQEVLFKLSPEKLGQWLDHSQSEKYDSVWPLSLLALKASASHLSIQRQPAVSHTLTSNSSQHCKHCIFLQQEQKNQIENLKVFSRYIKPKKSHEIHIIAKIASNCAERLGCKYIVDIGSGLGHLGRILALKHGLRVCCLEEQTNLTEKARQLDQQLIKALHKSQETTFDPPVHVNISIQAAVQHDDLLEIVRKAFDTKGDAQFSFGIVGLHPCGDLGPTLMRLLKDCPAACFINLVGCCYMKLSCDGSSNVQGFPLSQFTQKLDQPHHLSYEAREVACHAIETYCQRLRNGCVEELKVHCYRATLENIIVRKWPHLKHSGLRSIKNVQEMEFHRYAELAVERLGLEIPKSELDNEDIKSQLNQWLQVVAFYSMRLLLAPNIETAILLDRMLFLHEAGIPCILLPAFDPTLSPRNHVLIAMKE